MMRSNAHLALPAALLALLAAFGVAFSALDVHAVDTQPLVRGNFELRDGRLISLGSRKSITSVVQNVVQFTVSPDGRFVVFVRSDPAATRQDANAAISMWIFNTRTGRRMRVAKDLGIRCCALMGNIENKGYGNSVSLINGAYWTSNSQVLVTTPPGNSGTLEFFLSMDGKLRGDV